MYDYKDHENVVNRLFKNNNINNLKMLRCKDTIGIIFKIVDKCYNDEVLCWGTNPAMALGELIFSYSLTGSYADAINRVNNQYHEYLYQNS